MGKDMWTTVRTWLLAILFLSTCVTLAHAQAVTFADLEGATIHITRSEMRKVRFTSGFLDDQRMQQIRTVVIRPGGTLSGDLTNIVDRLQKGDTIKRSWSFGPVKLNQPFEFRDGKAIWVFENGTLTNMQTMSGGGHLAKIKFTKTANGITCSNDWGLAREQGTNSVKTTSTTSGNPSEILSAKQIGSSCRVTKK